MNLWQRLGKHLGTKRLTYLMRFYPPFLGAGIRVEALDPKLRAIRVEMPLNRFNQNYLGTHFGGSLFAMCDPFHVLILLNALGPDFVIWDKQASIDFIRPGRSRVHAHIAIDDATIEAIRQRAVAQGKTHPEFTVEIHDAAGHCVARVHKTLSVRWVRATH